MARFNHPKVIEKIGLSSNELFILVYCTCYFSHCFHPPAIKVHAVNGSGEKEGTSDERQQKKNCGRRVHRGVFCARSATKNALVLFYLTWIKKVDAALLNEHLQRWVFAQLVDGVCVCVCIFHLWSQIKLLNRAYKIVKIMKSLLITVVIKMCASWQTLLIDIPWMSRWNITALTPARLSNYYYY